MRKLLLYCLLFPILLYAEEGYFGEEIYNLRGDPFIILGLDKTCSRADIDVRYQSLLTIYEQDKGVIQILNYAKKMLVDFVEKEGSKYSDYQFLIRLQEMEYEQNSFMRVFFASLPDKTKVHYYLKAFESEPDNFKDFVWEVNTRMTPKTMAEKNQVLTELKIANSIEALMQIPLYDERNILPLTTAVNQIASLYQIPLESIYKDLFRASVFSLFNPAEINGLSQLLTHSISFNENISDPKSFLKKVTYSKKKWFSFMYRRTTGEVLTKNVKLSSLKQNFEESQKYNINEILKEKPCNRIWGFIPRRFFSKK